MCVSTWRKFEKAVLTTTDTDRCWHCQRWPPVFPAAAWRWRCADRRQGALCGSGDRPSGNHRHSSSHWPPGWGRRSDITWHLLSLLLCCLFACLFAWLFACLILSLFFVVANIQLKLHRVILQTLHFILGVKTNKSMKLSGHRHIACKPYPDKMLRVKKWRC